MKINIIKLQGIQNKLEKLQSSNQESITRKKVIIESILKETGTKTLEDSIKYLDDLQEDVEYLKEQNERLYNDLMEEIRNDEQLKNKLGSLI